MKKNQTEKNLDENVNIRPNNNLLKTIQSMILIIVLIFIGIILGYFTFFWLNEKNYKTLKLETIKIIKTEINNEFEKNHSNQLINTNAIKEELLELSEKLVDIDIQLNSLKKLSPILDQKEESLAKEITLINSKIIDIKKEFDQIKKSKQKVINNSLNLENNKSLNQSGNLLKNNEALILLYENILNDKPWDNQLYNAIRNHEKELLSKFNKEEEILFKFAKSPITNKQIFIEFEMLLPEILKELPAKDDSLREKILHWLVKTTQLRPADGSKGSLPYDKVAQIEKALKENHLIKAHEIFQTLPFQMKEPAINWLGKLSFKIELEKSMQKLIQEKRILTK